MKASCKQFLAEQFNGDEEVIQDIYKEYVASMIEKTADIASAAAGGEWDRLDGLAHTVKGNALVAGDNDTAETAIALRSAARLREEAEIRRLVARLRELAAEL